MLLSDPDGVNARDRIQGEKGSGLARLTQATIMMWGFSVPGRMHG